MECAHLMMWPSGDQHCKNGSVEVGTRSYFFFQAEDGIRDYKVTGVQTCALPIWRAREGGAAGGCVRGGHRGNLSRRRTERGAQLPAAHASRRCARKTRRAAGGEIRRAPCRGRGENSGVAVSLKKKKMSACGSSYR